MERPGKNEYASFYETYTSLVSETDILAALAGQPTEIADLFVALPEDQGRHAYAEGKWTVKELLSHVIDGERMFAYRAFRISRGDTTPIEGFEQDIYIEHSYANDRSFAELLEEFKLLRRANLLFMSHLSDEDWQRMGTASGSPVSVRALAYIMAGHVRHHVNILKERYLA